MNIEVKKRSPYGTAALTLGIISIVLFLYWCISVPCGILGIVLGEKGKKMVASKLAVAGKVTGIVGITLSCSILLLVLFVFLIEAYF